MKFFTRKYFAPVMKFAVSAISSSEAIEGPRMWNTAKVICPDFAASRKPMSRNEASAGDNRPARTSITVTEGLDRIQRIEDLHLVRCRRHVDDLGDVGVEALQGAARRFGIEGAGEHVVGAEIIQQGSRDRRLADPAFVSTYHNHYWLRHELPLCAILDWSILEQTRMSVSGKPGSAPIMPRTPTGWVLPTRSERPPPALGANMAETRENSNSLDHG